MSDLDKIAPSEGNRGTLEDLMEAAIADAENEKDVEENVEEIPKDGNQEKDIEEKTTDEINNLEGDDTAHLQKDINEAGKNNKEDNDDLEEDKKKDEEDRREDAKSEEPKLSVLDSDENIAKTSNDENAGEGKDNLEKTEDIEKEHEMIVKEKTDTDDNESFDKIQDKECSNPIIDVDADHGGGIASLSCNLDEVFASTESEGKGEVMRMLPELLSSVYEFQGSKEFAKKAGGNRNQLRMCLTNMQKAHTEGYCEIDLYHLRNWYSQFRFCALIDDTSDGSSFVWHYRLIIMDPLACRVKQESKSNERVSKMMKVAKAFYMDGFEPNPVTEASIAIAVENEITLMILARKIKKGSAFNTMWQNPSSTVSVAAITFRHSVDKSSPSDVATFVSWLAVSMQKKGLPKSIDGWRRKGFGLFMIIASIKVCFSIYQNPIESKPAARTKPKTDKSNQDRPPMLLHIYLQSQEIASTQFYIMIGFQTINGKFADGFELLPLHLQESIMESASSKEPGKCVFHFYEQQDDRGKVNDLRASKLMYLRPGELRHFLCVEDEYASMAEDAKEEPPGEQTSDAVIYPGWNKLWCKFPPYPVNGERLEYSSAIMTKAFSKLAFVQALLPPPYAAPLFPRGSVTGDMSILSRIEHTQKKGEKWMATGEVDLMIATMLFDRRYEDLCFVLHCAYSLHLEYAADLYIRYKNALAYHDAAKEEKNYVRAKTDEEIVKLFRGSVNQLLYDYKKSMNTVIRIIINGNPGMLERRVLVFPKNEGNQHWSCVFVFNASYIDEEEDQKIGNVSLRPCFFRYCSLSRYGHRKVGLDQGIVWFLNLVYSYETHLASQTGGVMTWLEPFGSKINGFMEGTHLFPSLRFPLGSNYLPFQHDGYNCGVGICAAIAIVLRDLVVKDQVSNDAPYLYDQYFKAENMELKFCKERTEMYCDMPLVFFKSLRDEDDFVWGDYLKLLREEWFMLIDRLAEEEHVLCPKRLFPKYQIKNCYTGNIAHIMQWPYKTNDRGGAETRSTSQTSPAKGTLRVGLTKKNNKSRRKLPTQTAAGIVDITGTPPSQTMINNESASVQDYKIPRLNKENNSSKKNDSTNIVDEHQQTKESGDSKVLKDPSVNETEPELATENAASVTQTQDDIESEREEKDANGNKIRIQTGVPFSKTKLKTPLKRKLHSSDVHANEILKRIKISDPQDAKRLEKAQNPQANDATQKYCTQSRKEGESFLKKYGSELPKPPSMTAKDYQAEMEAFIEHSFSSWRWHTHAQHEKCCNDWTEKLKVPGLGLRGKVAIRVLVKAMKDERAKFRKDFANEFKFNRKALVKGVKYERETNRFSALLVWTEPVHSGISARDENVGTDEEDGKPKAKDDEVTYVQKTETIPVNENWIKEAYGEETFQHIINMRKTMSFIQVPRDVLFYINNKKVLRLRYIAPQSRSIVDTEALAAIIEAELEEVEKKKKEDEEQRIAEGRLPTPPPPPPMTPDTPKLRPLMLVRVPIRGTPPKVARKSLVEFNEELNVNGKGSSDKNDKDEQEEEDEEVPRKTIMMTEKWVAKLEDGHECPMEEEEVRRAFGDTFANEMKAMIRGFVDIPVGDYKPSHLYQHPNLRVIGAPAIYYRQADGKDLCVSKALASAFHNLGWHMEASMIDTFGETNLKGGNVEVLERVVEYSRTVFPTWIVIDLLPNNFDWRCDMRHYEVLLGVLLANDNSCSHAVAIHDNFVIDANEAIALPLCAEALNYCTSTAHVKSEFVRFKRGFRFHYKGKKKTKLERMTWEHSG
jgi:hypothetical protein